MRPIWLALAFAAGLAATASADDYDGYDCPQLPPATTTDSQSQPPEAGA